VWLWRTEVFLFLYVSAYGKLCMFQLQAKFTFYLVPQGVFLLNFVSQAWFLLRA